MRRPLALVVFALVATAACGPIDEFDGGARAGAPDLASVPVLFLGDSLTVGARQEGGLVDLATEEGIAADVVAQEGRDVEWAIELAQARPEVPPIVIVELGTNPSSNPDDFPTEVANMIEVLRSRGATTIAWVTPVHRDDRYDDKVAVLEAAAAEGALVVADWRAKVRENPDWMIRDGLHYTDEGYAALAEFLVTTAGSLAPAP